MSLDPTHRSRHEASHTTDFREDKTIFERSKVSSRTGVDCEPGQLVWGCVFVNGSPRDILEWRSNDLHFGSADLTCARGFACGHTSRPKDFTHSGRKFRRCEMMDIMMMYPEFSGVRLFYFRY